MLPMNRLQAAVGGNDISSFASGRLGMGTRWLSTLVAFADSPYNIGMVPYPRGPADGGRYATDLGMFGLAINRMTENAEAAWRFVAFVTGPRGAEFAGTIPGQTPTRPAPVTWMPENVVNPEIYPDLLLSGTLRIISKDRLDLDRIINEEVARVLANEATPESAATEIVRRTASSLAVQQ